MEPEQLQTAFGNAVRAERSKRGYSQESFADAVGVHRTYIGAVERGEQNLSLQNLIRIACTLGVQPSQLLELAEVALDHSDQGAVLLHGEH